MPTEITLGFLTPAALKGEITALKVQEDDGTGAFVDTPNHIMRTDRVWKVVLEWQLEGSLLASSFVTLNGSWLPHAYLEGWGKAASEVDKEAGPIDINTHATDTTGTDPIWKYRTEFLFPPAAANKPNPGNYRLAVALTFQDVNNNPVAIAGFLEYATMLQVYTPVP